MLNTRNSLRQKGQFLLLGVSNTHGEEIQELCSALMHWLWSYVMCLPEQWRETLMHTNNSGAQCPLATLETIHTLFLAWGLFIVYNNVCLHAFIFCNSPFWLFKTQCNSLNLFLMSVLSSWSVWYVERSVLEDHSRDRFDRMNLNMNHSSLEQFPSVNWQWPVFLFECKAAKLKVLWTLRVSNRRDQQVFHLAAVQIE